MQNVNHMPKGRFPLPKFTARVLGPSTRVVETDLKNMILTYEWWYYDSQAEETREDFGHLPPIQQRKQLTQKLDSLQAALTKDTTKRYWQ